MASFGDMIKKVKTEKKSLAEKSPPGFEGTVKAMKKHKEIDNPWALAWYEKNKGDKSHRTKSGAVKESFEGRKVEHPTRGTGIVVGLSEAGVEVRWDNVAKRILGNETISYEDAKYLSLVETYSKDSEVKKLKGKKMMKKPVKKAKKKVSESMVAIPTISTTEKKTNGFDLTMADLFFEEDANKAGGFDFDGQGITRTKSEFYADSEEPLATHDGHEAAEEGVRDDGKMPDDAPEVPKFREMEKTGNTVAKGKSEVNKGEFKRDHKENKVDNSLDRKGPQLEEPKGQNDGSEDKHEEPKWKKMEESKKPTSYRSLVESLNMRFADIDDDIVSLNECGDEMMDECSGMMPEKKMREDDGDLAEHNMAAGEIAMTQDLMKKLLAAVVRDQPDEAAIGNIALGLATAIPEDRTLTVDDIGAVMAKIKELHGQGSTDDDVSADDARSEDEMNADDDIDAVNNSDNDEIADESEGDDDSEGESDEGSSDDSEEDQFEDKAEGDGKPAGAEGGKEHEGRTKLMDRKGLSEKHIGFDKLEHSLAHKKGVKDAGAIAASIGRKKYGKKKFQKAAAAHHSIHEGIDDFKSFLLKPLMKATNPSFAHHLFDKLHEERPDLYKALEQIFVHTMKDTKGLGAVSDVAAARSLMQNPKVQEIQHELMQWAQPHLQNMPKFNDWAAKKTAQLKNAGISVPLGGDPMEDNSYEEDSDSPMDFHESKKTAKKGELLIESIMMAVIPTMAGQNSFSDAYASDADDEDEEIKMIKRRSGLERWWK